MQAIIDPKLLKPKAPVSNATWQFWEKKNLNIHRGIIELNIEESLQSVNDLALQIRETVKVEFRPGWFRGFGFGTVMHAESLSDDFAEICNHIDKRNRRHGVWQWAILQFDSDEVAIGLHTWQHGFLRPVYDSILARLEENGYECSSSDAEIDEFIAKCMKVYRTCSAIQRIGGLFD